MTQQFANPPTMVRTQAGNFVAAAGPHKVIDAPKKFLLVIQYYEDDKADAEDMAALICDLERIKNKDVDVLLFSRADAGPFAPDVVAKLKLKFNDVIIQKCVRKDAKGYPFGCNGMFYDLVTMFGQQTRWLNAYYAFLNLEPDCAPLCAGWLMKLIQAFKEAASEGSAVLGHIHNDPIQHVNGVAVYAIDVWRRVPGGALGGGNPTMAFDIRHAKNLLPLAVDTPLIYFQFRKPTITADELFAEHKGVPAVLYHGVKDGSAREAVRAKCITFSSDRDFSRKTVFTLFNPENEITAGDEKAVLAIWREGWQSRGWNPVVLRAQEVMKNGRYEAMVAALEKFPMVGSRHDWQNGFFRYLALDTMGGGFYADVDVLPTTLTPRGADGIIGFETLDGARGSMVYADKDTLSQWLDAMIDYPVHDDDLLNGKPHVSDATIMAREINEMRIKSQKWVETYGEDGYESFRAVKFADTALNRHARGKRKSAVMEVFLRTT